MTATFYVGDAIEVMSKLPEKSVDLILTSPPFLALRSYLPNDHPDKALEGGSQSTPGEFIDWLVDVVEACDRVLAPHGSLCFELGDTYSGHDNRGSSEDNGHYESKTRSVQTGPGWPLAKSLSLIPELFRLTLVYGFNPLTGRQTDRWRLRNVVRWVRPNPPVGALGDKFRPATSDLMVFCKSAKRYFDLDAVREPLKYDYKPYDRAPDSKAASRAGKVGEGPRMDRAEYNPAGAPPLDWWNIPLLDGEEETRQSDKGKPRNRQAEPSMSRGGNWNTFPNYESSHPGGAPPLDWWNIPPGGFSGSHYAVFPPELCIKPIKAMCPERVCRQCGEPSRRIVGEAEYVNPRTGLKPTIMHFRDGERGDKVIGFGVREPQNLPTGDRGAIRVADTIGWSICGSRCKQCGGTGKIDERQGDGYVSTDCEFCDGGVCDAHDDWRPGLVLDPFVGSGTTLLVATGHGRDAIGIDLDERNYDLALNRVGPFILERAG